MPNRRRGPEDLIPDDQLSDQYSSEYLEACSTPDARRERLEELKRRIALDKYVIEPDRLAEELLLRLGGGSDDD